MLNQADLEQLDHEIRDAIVGATIKRLVVLGNDEERELGNTMLALECQQRGGEPFLLLIKSEPKSDNAGWLELFKPG